MYMQTFGYTVLEDTKKLDGKNNARIVDGVRGFQSGRVVAMATRTTRLAIAA